MTEAEWDACADPMPMLESLKGKASDRKLRLFVTTCCRRFWSSIPRLGRTVVETSERHADGLASASELSAAAEAQSEQDRRIRRAGSDASPAAALAFYASYASGLHFAAATVVSAASSAAIYTKHAGINAHELERAAHAQILRELFGNPFNPVSISPSWLIWNDGAVRKLAQAAYDARTFDRLPLLADALEDAGCADAAILAHCRGPGEHVRGCWCVDLLLGKT